MTDQTLLHDTPTVARLLGLSEVTLRKWRIQERREGPAWIKCGKAVRYREADLQAWLSHQTVSSAAATGASDGDRRIEAHLQSAERCQ